MAKKRNKKYSVERSYTRLARLEARRLAVLNVGSLGTFLFSEGKQIPFSYDKARILNTVAHKWTILIGVACRDTFGKDYIKTRELACVIEYTTEAISDFVSEEQRKLIQDCNSRQLLTIFWVAVPQHDYQFSLEKVTKLLTETGAFSEHITPHEDEERRKQSAN